RTLGAAIVHPDLKEVPPPGPEPIRNDDGAAKNDRELPSGRFEARDTRRTRERRDRGRSAVRLGLRPAARRRAVRPQGGHARMRGNGQSIHVLSQAGIWSFLRLFSPLDSVFHNPSTALSTGARAFGSARSARRDVPAGLETVRRGILTNRI
ncbi:MAG: hypothetical protein OXD29_08560, partial [Roseovarius sp.]|nr:hypothetical protein [Roseovarius sp.]